MLRALLTGTPCRDSWLTLPWLVVQRAGWQLPHSGWVRLGRELQELVSAKLDSRRGQKLVLHHNGSELLPFLTLQQQGLDSNQEATVSCTFVPANLYTAFVYANLYTAEFPMEGVTQLEGAPPGLYMDSLPEYLQSLAFGRDCNQSL